MPLLHKQKFIRKEIPANLDPNQEIFFCKLTQEIFLDYDEYFERTILCNSLVWTCALSGKTGLTFPEALESEQRARKAISSFPQALERALLFLVRYTKRGNVKDLIDDLFGYVKDRYFVGENVSVLVGQNNSSKADIVKPCKILGVILPSGSPGAPTKDTSQFEFNDEVIDVEADFSHSMTTPATATTVIDPNKIKYLIETQLNGSSVQSTVRASQLSRAKGLLTKDKIQIIIKNNCEVTSSYVAWTVKESAVARYHLDRLEFGDIFKGEPPQFEASFGRHQKAGANVSGAATPKASQSSGSRLSTTPKTAKGAKASLGASGKKKKDVAKGAAGKGAKGEGKKRTKSASEPSPAKPRKAGKEPKPKAAAKPSNSKLSPTSKQALKSKQIEEAAMVETEHDLFARKIVQILDLKVIDMTDEEYELWREFKPNDDLRELRLIEAEIERTTKREEKEKEKERLKQEKEKQREYLKELKKPKEDLECDNLLELPRPVAIQSKIPQSMFGDSLMQLEFLNYFGELFEIKDDFPNGFNFELLENALFSKSYDSALCNLLLFYLDAIFKCYEEEKFDDSNCDSDDESSDEEPAAANGAVDSDDDEQVSIEQLYNDPVQRAAQDRDSFSAFAEKCSRLVKSIQGRGLKTIGLDVYSISEMLRLYFLTSGCSHNSKTKFWYQQRGGYTHMDEAGIDFTLNETAILRKLETTTVYELDSSDKLKILTNLCHQLMTQVRFRDLIEDSCQKLLTLRGQLRDLQVEENRRQREETSERWKKRMQDKAKERAARIEEAKSGAEASKPSKERSSLSNDSTSLQGLKTTTTGGHHSEESNDEPLVSKKQMEESNRRRQEFLRKEKLLLEEIFQSQAKCSLCPLGRDRFFRRYWVFKTLPGLFVEEEDSIDCSALFAPSASASVSVNTSLNSAACSSDAVKHENGAEEEEEMEIDSKEPQAAEQKNGKENHPGPGDENGFGYNKTPGVGGGFQSPSKTGKKEESKKWSFYYREEDIEKLIANLNERGLRESELKQNLIDFKERIYESIRKSSLFKSLTMSHEDIEKSLRTCLKENISNVLQNSANTTNQTVGSKTKRQAAKIAAQLASTGNNFSTVTAQEYMEMDLRDKLLEIEELVFVGALGTLKVTDRFKWRDAIEKSAYDAQTSKLVYGGDVSIVASARTNNVRLSAAAVKAEPGSTATVTATTGNGKHPDASLGIVNDLAKALLQIEQSVERRFLRLPLGESQKTPERRGRKPKAANGADAEAGEPEADSNKWQILHNWEKSLMSCTTLSQLFVHLQSLDESIAWSKSAMNARCRLCRRKGDAEKMLLCDKCDRGHHIYCLRPQLTSIPEGEWFCPECKPKSGPKTPRKMRKSFAGNDANSDGEEADEADEDDEEENDEEDEENEDDDEEEEDEDDESEEEEEEEVEEVKIVAKPRGRPRKKPIEVPSEDEEESGSEDEDAEDDEEGEENGGEDDDDDDEEEEDSDEESNDEEDEDNEEEADENGDEESGGEEEDEEMAEKSGSESNDVDDNESEKARKPRSRLIRLNGNHLNGNKKSNTSNSSDDDVMMVDSHDEQEEEAAESADEQPVKRRGRPSKKMKLDEAVKLVTAPVSSRSAASNLKSASSTSISTTRSSSSARAAAAASRSTTGHNTSGESRSTGSRASRGKVNYSEATSDEETQQKRRGRPPKNKPDSPVLSTASAAEVSISNTNSRNTEMAQRLKIIEKLLNDMMKHPDAWPFLKPVYRRDAPDYYEVIKKPMDFSTIKNNINHFKYDDYTHIVDDIRLVFENCWEYNEPGSDIYRTGQRLSQHFESQAKQAGLLDSKRLALPGHQH